MQLNLSQPAGSLHLHLGLVLAGLDPLLLLLVYALGPEDGADLTRSGLGLWCTLICKAAGIPAVTPLAAVHPHVKTGQLPGAQQAWRGAAQRAILLLAPHHDVAARLAPHPSYHRMLRDATLARLIHP